VIRYHATRELTSIDKLAVMANTHNQRRNYTLCLRNNAL